MISLNRRDIIVQDLENLGVSRRELQKEVLASLEIAQFMQRKQKFVLKKLEPSAVNWGACDGLAGLGLDESPSLDDRLRLGYRKNW